ncbi:hypothetical protein T492DRAFT_850982 [Pavlovales sp. CCMP2436]|nr:hypothetical protein T492DRAFT_850982 [Pavlovales sp. CCMP2436]
MLIDGAIKLGSAAQTPRMPPSGVFKTPFLYAMVSSRRLFATESVLQTQIKLGPAAQRLLHRSDPLQKLVVVVICLLHREDLLHERKADGGARAREARPDDRAHGVARGKSPENARALSLERAEAEREEGGGREGESCSVLFTGAEGGMKELLEPCVILFPP